MKRGPLKPEPHRPETWLDTPVKAGYWAFVVPPPVAKDRQGYALTSWKEQLEWIWNNLGCLAPDKRCGLVSMKGQIIGYTKRTIRYSIPRSRYRKRSGTQNLPGIIRKSSGSAKRCCKAD